MITNLSFEPKSKTSKLQLIYPQLINWDQQHHAPIVGMFQNNEAITEFMGLHNGLPSGDHQAGFEIKIKQREYFGGEIASSSHKNKSKNLNIKLISPSENHNVALLDCEKGKKKDVF